MNLNEQIENLKSNEEIDVTISTKSKEKKPPYTIIGSGFTTKEFKEDVVVDVFDLISKMSGEQIQIFKFFRNEINKNNMQHRFKQTENREPNVIKIPKTTLDDEAQLIRKLISRNRNGSSLIKLGAIKKIKTGEFMVNPYALIPNNNFELAVKNWENIN